MQFDEFNVIDLALGQLLFFMQLLVYELSLKQFDEFKDID